MIMRLIMRRGQIGSFLLAGIALLTGAAQVEAQSQAPTTHVLIVTGLSGEARLAESFAKSGAALVDAATGAWAADAANVVWLAEAVNVDRRVKARSTRENVESELRSIADRAGDNDAVLILFFGHGSARNGETRVNLPGPDLTGAELALLLQPLRTQRVAVVNTASASGGFIQDLAAPNRVVITATKSGFEQNETVFGTHFTTALTDDDADVNQDGRVSLLEAYDYARREVAREYERGNLLLTEHAMLDAVGDGVGVSETDRSDPHGRIASAFVFGPAGGAAAANASPELRALYGTRDQLQGELDALRARRDVMAESAYEAELERLLLEIARTAQSIRRLEGGGA